MLNGILFRNSILQIFLCTHYSPSSTVGRLSTKDRSLIKKKFLNNFVNNNNKNKNAIGFYGGRRSLDQKKENNESAKHSDMVEVDLESSFLCIFMYSKGCQMGFTHRMDQFDFAHVFCTYCTII